MSGIQQRTIERIGMISKNNFGTDMKIIKVLEDNRVIIQFQDEHKFEKDIHFGNFKSGNVKNPYDKIRYGVGYIGAGNYKVESILGTHDKSYDVWQNMLERCYSEKLRYKHKAYEECTVCEKWHNYQNFAKWYKNHSYDLKEGRLHLDKDIKQKNNIVYSPETCLLIPQRINMIFMGKTNKWNFPSGISLSYNNKYITSYNGKHLGILDTLDEAIKAHDKAKRIHIKQIAEEYKEIVPTKVYKALLAW